LSGHSVDSGTEGTVNWPARSPDFYAIDFILWGYFETNVRATAVDTTDELWRRVQRFEIETRNSHGIFERLRVPPPSSAEFCIHEHGGHFE
jgi:hypothetical protein